MSLKAIIFDVDGTLTESEDLHRAAFNKVFAEYGLGVEWDRELYGELLLVAGGRERLSFYLENYEWVFDPTRCSGINDLAQTLHRRKTEIFAEMVDAGGLTLRPGVERLIRETKSSAVALAIATTTRYANLRALVANTLQGELEDYFDVVCTGDDGQTKKPAPDVYRRTLDALGLRGQECLAIEDSEIGLRAGLAADIATLVTVNSYTEEQNFAGAAAVVSSLGEPDTPAAQLEGEFELGPVIGLATLGALHADCSIDEDDPEDTR